MLPGTSSAEAAREARPGGRWFCSRSPAQCTRPAGRSLGVPAAEQQLAKRMGVGPVVRWASWRGSTFLTKAPRAGSPPWGGGGVGRGGLSMQTVRGRKQLLTQALKQNPNQDSGPVYPRAKRRAGKSNTPPDGPLCRPAHLAEACTQSTTSAC